MSVSTQSHVDVNHIREHYDRLSFLYRMFWGEHLHHGYWDGDETVPQAQIRLMEQLAERAGVSRGARVLDIGCGLGGSAFWLAEQSGASPNGQQESKGQRAQRSRSVLGEGNNIVDTLATAL